MNYTFIFPNFTILFLFLYFFVLIPSVLKNAFNVWKYTSNNDQKKCTTAIRSEKMSVIPVIPLWHLAHISHGCQHFRRAMFFPGVPFHPPHICLSLFSFSLYRSNPSKEIPFLRAESLLEMFGHTKLIKNAISIEYLKPEDSYRPNCWQKPCNRDI